MRLKLTLFLVALPALSGAQVWEKSVAPGLMYREEIDLATPRIIHALRFSPGSATTAKAVLAGGTIYEENETKGRGNVSDMVATEGAIAGINADFFPYTGDPLGAMIRNGELLSIPTFARSSFGWKNEAGTGLFGIMSFKGAILAKEAEIALDNINAECGLNQVVVNTGAAAFSMAKAPNVQIVLALDDAKWAPNGTVSGIVQSITADQLAVKVERGTAVLVAQGNKVISLTSMRTGDRVSVRYQSDGFDWAKIDNMVGGGPVLLKDGAISTDAEQERFKPDFTNGRHPRTAVGKDAKGDLWFVAIDGRQKMSAGATIQEMAQIMQKLGCRDAINLDGGGSTDLNILGVTVNRPSEGKERPVANAVLFYGPRPKLPISNLTLEGAATVDLTETLKLSAAENGKPVDGKDVIWSAQGTAWIDQDGLLRPWNIGTATVTAWIKGRIVVKTITVTKKTG